MAVVIAVSPTFERNGLGWLAAPLAGAIFVSLMPSAQASEKRAAWLVVGVACFNAALGWWIESAGLQHHREDIFVGVWVAVILLAFVYSRFARRAAQLETSTRSSIETL
ncbi:MAG TPA: hypothetical protein VFL13_04645 [Candidatus Baltobacteraceae bacterium]|nr:hypothetical protein [Candidatus Baltobacteraceae bacterium]